MLTHMHMANSMHVRIVQSMMQIYIHSNMFMTIVSGLGFDSLQSQSQYNSQQGADIKPTTRLTCMKPILEYCISYLNNLIVGLFL